MLDVMKTIFVPKYIIHIIQTVILRQNTTKYANITLFSTLEVFNLPVEGIRNNQFAYCLRFSRVKMRILLLFHLQNILVQNNNMACPIFFHCWMKFLIIKNKIVIHLLMSLHELHWISTSFEQDSIFEMQFWSWL